MKKNLIFKLCFIVGIFLIILSACDLGTKQWANLTFSLEGPTLEGRATQEGRSSSSRYIHPDANYLIFELFSGNTSLSKTTQSITDGKDISIRLEKVPLNDPNLRAEIKVWKNGPTQGADLLGQNSIHLGRIGLGYTKLTLGVKPVSGANVAYEMMDEDGIYLYNSSDIVADTFNIKMYPQKGLYTLESSVDNIYLYDSDGKNYKNSFFINDGNTNNTLIFYHPEDKANTYYAYLSKETDYLDGYKLAQDILITRPDDYDPGNNVIVASEENINFGYLSPSGNSSTEIFFTIYNPYPFTLYPNYSSKGESLEDFTFKDFPDAILPGTSKEFTVIFETTKPSVSVSITISANGLESFVMIFTGTSSE